MKFLANENIPIKVIDMLKNDGIDIFRVDLIKKGMKDKEIIKHALEEKRILITFDKDFGELVFKNKEKIKGIILLRFSPLNPEFVYQRLKSLFSYQIDIAEKFIVINEEKIRVRELKI